MAKAIDSAGMAHRTAAFQLARILVNSVSEAKQQDRSGGPASESSTMSANSPWRLGATTTV